MPFNHSGSTTCQGLGLLGLLVFSGISSLQPARAGMMEQIIVKQCAQQMLDDFTKAGKTAPAGMIDSTCNCVVARLQQTNKLDHSIKSCTADARAKYNL